MESPAGYLPVLAGVRLMSEGAPRDDLPRRPNRPKRVAIACQGGGSHTAFTAGVLGTLLEGFPDEYELVGVSGTSGGAACALLGWYGWVHPDHSPRELLLDFWTEIAGSTPMHRAVNTLVQVDVGLRQLGVPLPDVSPAYFPGSWWAQRELRRSIDRLVSFDRIPDLLDGSEPALLVSAIDVVDGRFVIFREDEVTSDAILASAAEPHLFPAVEVEGRHYWDGLFSKNPPMKDFLTETDIPDPDELWIIMINPQEREGVPRSIEEIDNRRNELSGNLSLNAEVRFIETVNTWIEQGYLPEQFTYTEIRRLRFPRRHRLDWRSKLDRDPDFLAELIREGKAVASAFLTEA